MGLNERLNAVSIALNIEPGRTRLAELDAAISDPHLWDDPTSATKITQEQAALTSLIRAFDDIAILIKTVSEEEAMELVGEELARLEQQALLAGKYDANDAILSIYAGAGGTDAADWAEMLLRMYQRYTERASGADDAIINRHDWKFELVDSSPAEEAGIKSATVIISGHYAYGLLKAEAGVHRLVRQSPFNAKGLRQTSFAQVDVIPKIDQADDVVINEKDLRVDVFRSAGAGGQSVNTTDSAVRVTHIPTGIVVAIQNERSQLQNKAKAMEILRSKLAMLAEQERAAETANVRGDMAKNEWGSQIRSYILHPYKMVKDHRTEVETSNVNEVLDGDINQFITPQLVAMSKQ